MTTPLPTAILDKLEKALENYLAPNDIDGLLEYDPCKFGDYLEPQGIKFATLIGYGKIAECYTEEGCKALATLLTNTPALLAAARERDALNADNAKLIRGVSEMGAELDDLVELNATITQQRDKWRELFELNKLDAERLAEAVSKCYSDIHFWSEILAREWHNFDGQLYTAANLAKQALEAHGDVLAKLSLHTALESSNAEKGGQL